MKSHTLLISVLARTAGNPPGPLHPSRPMQYLLEFPQLTKRARLDGEGERELAA